MTLAGLVKNGSQTADLGTDPASYGRCWKLTLVKLVLKLLSERPLLLKPTVVQPLMPLMTVLQLLMPLMTVLQLLMPLMLVLKLLPHPPEFAARCGCVAAETRIGISAQPASSTLLVDMQPSAWS